MSKITPIKVVSESNCGIQIIWYVLHKIVSQLETSSAIYTCADQLLREGQILKSDFEIPTQKIWVQKLD